MIFPNYNYQSYHNDNKEDWPIQPPTQEAWNTMHNEAFIFCESLSPNDLPTFHTYWKAQAKVQTYEYAITLINKLIKCTKDPSKFKYEFNATSNTESVLRLNLYPSVKLLLFKKKS